MRPRDIHASFSACSDNVKAESRHAKVTQGKQACRAWWKLEENACHLTWREAREPKQCL